MKKPTAYIMIDFCFSYYLLTKKRNFIWIMRVWARRYSKTHKCNFFIWQYESSCPSVCIFYVSQKKCKIWLKNKIVIRAIRGVSEVFYFD